MGQAGIEAHAIALAATTPGLLLGHQRVEAGCHFVLGERE